MVFGDLELFSLSDGSFALDGGAMFGVIPRVFWQKTNPPDERNRISLALRPLLVKTPDALVLIDTGIGDKQDGKFRDVYRVDHSARLLDSLGSAGFSPEDVTHVVNTHLHFDHCGGNTVVSSEQAAGSSRSKIVTTFPNAKYVVQETEWQAATSPDKRSRASYLPENFLPIQEQGQLVLVAGDREIVPGVRVLHTSGHTVGHQAVVVESQGKKAMYWGDLIPTASHVNVPYIMGYDTMPLITMDRKEALLKAVLGEQRLMFFEHDPVIASGYLGEEQGRYVVKSAND